MHYEYMVCLDGGPPPTSYIKDNTTPDPYLALGVAQDLSKDYPDVVVTIVVTREEN